MKTILVPTDFSKIAQNAINYAVEIAIVTKAKIILFHVYHTTVVPAEMYIAQPIDEIEKDALENLKKIEREIHLEHGNKLIIECKCKYGFPVDEINNFAQTNKIDLIVMGMEGSGYLTEKIIGSITTSLIKKAKCPVLAIDKHIKFKSIKKIALACDYSEINTKEIFTPLKELAQVFNSHVYVLNVVRELEPIFTVTKSVKGIKLNHTLEDVTHSFHYTESEDIIDGINDFVDEKKIDMLVMIPRMHSVLRNLFNESVTKRMAFHTKVPLLALHE